MAWSGQINFQNPASPIAVGLIDLHHTIFFFLLLIFLPVIYFFTTLLINTAYKWLFPDWIFMYEIAEMHDILNSVDHHIDLETYWTLLPTLCLMFIALPSFALLYSIDEILDPQLTYKAIGHQWYWSYETPTADNFDSYLKPLSDLHIGQLRLLEVDQALVCPINVHLRFIVTSVDVLHSFAIPSLGLKVDAVPGRLNQVSAFITRPGMFFGQCSELCGVNHGFMPIKLIAL